MFAVAGFSGNPVKRRPSDGHQGGRNAVARVTDTMSGKRGQPHQWRLRGLVDRGPVETKQQKLRYTHVNSLPVLMRRVLVKSLNLVKFIHVQTLIVMFISCNVEFYIIFICTVHYFKYCH